MEAVSIQHALLGADDVLWSLVDGAKTEYAVVPLLEGRRHRRDVSGTVWVGGGDDDDGCAPIEDSGVEDLVRHDKGNESVLEG